MNAQILNQIDKMNYSEALDLAIANLRNMTVEERDQLGETLKKTSPEAHNLFTLAREVLNL